MINLPQVTLVCMTGANYKVQEHMEALRKSSEQIKFGAVKYIINPNIKNIDDWNYNIIYELPNYIKTEYALLVHSDGYVINPELWNPDWLTWDYIGAPWPLPWDDFSYRDEVGRIQRVGNSVSLRSKKLMDLMAMSPKEYFWIQKERYGNTNEDGYICCHNRVWLEKLHGCKFAPLEVAIHFSKEHEITENKNIKTFAFHQV